MEKENFSEGNINSGEIRDDEIIDAKDAKIAALQAQVNQLIEAVGKLTAVQPQVTQPANPLVTERIKIIHLVDRAPGLNTIIELSNLKITMNTFGEERSLGIQQFEELVGKYRTWFYKGIIAVHSDNEEAAKHYGLPSSKNYPVNNDFFRTLGDKKIDAIESIYPRLPQAGRDSLLSYWVREAREGNPKFADIRKLETLNRLSDGAMTQLISELNNKRK